MACRIVGGRVEGKWLAGDELLLDYLWLILARAGIGIRGKPAGYGTTLAGSQRWVPLVWRCYFSDLALHAR